MYFGNNLRILRKKSGLSQEHIAEKLGYKSYTTIQKWESGDSEPSVRVIKKLAEMFRVTMNELLNDNMEIVKETVCEEPIEDEILKVLLSNYKLLNKEGKEELLLHSNFITGQDRYKNFNQFRVGQEA